MTALRIAGIVLIILGAVALAYKGFSYSKKEEVFRLGDIARVEATTKERVEIPAWVGFVLIGGGLVLLLVPQKKSR